VKQARFILSVSTSFGFLLAGAPAYAQSCGYCEYSYQRALYECAHAPNYNTPANCYQQARFNFNMCKMSVGCQG
jgi:hypothetical protein